MKSAHEAAAGVYFSIYKKPKPDKPKLARKGSKIDDTPPAKKQKVVQSVKKASPLKKTPTAVKRKAEKGNDLNRV